MIECRMIGQRTLGDRGGKRAVTAGYRYLGGRPSFVWASRQRVTSVVLLAAALIAMNSTHRFLSLHNIVTCFFRPPCLACSRSA